MEQDFSRSASFWRQALENVSAPTPLAVDRAVDRASDRPAEQGTRSIRLSPLASAGLERLAGEGSFTLNTLVQGAWALLIGRYSGEPRVLFGATRACRRSHLPDGPTMVGMFINTVPVRADLPAESALRPWLEELRRHWVAMREHEHTPLHRIQEWSEMAPGVALFDSLVLFDPSSMEARLRSLGGAWAERGVRVLGDPGYPLMLQAFRTRLGGGELELVLHYDGVDG